MGPLPKKAPHNVIAQKPRLYARANGMRGRDYYTFIYPFTKTELRRRVRQLNTPERHEWNGGPTPVSFAKRELLKER